MSGFAPGSTFAGLHVLAPLGRGATCAVFRARDPRTGRDVALKVLAPELRSDPELRARFRREGAAAAKVSHPNVARVLASGEVEGVPFLVVELLEGGSLADRLATAGPLPWREAARLGAGIAAGLGAIHAAGLVHRDLKPANVLLDAEGRPRLADFGLVRTASGEALTRTGDALGTAEYMAPEQIESSRDVDARADLYALGATLHALVAGAPPFRGAPLSVTKKVLLERPAPLRSLVPHVPPAFEALVLRLLAKRPDERPRAASEVATLLAALASEEPGAARRPRRALAVGALVAGVVLAAAALAARVALGPLLGGTGGASDPAHSLSPLTPPPAPRTTRLAAQPSPVASRDPAGRLAPVTLEPVRTIGGPDLTFSRTIGGLALTPDGKTLVVGASDGLIRTFDARTGAPDAPAWSTTITLTSVAVASSASRVAVAGLRGELLAWDLRTRESVGTGQLVGSASAIALDATGERALVGTRGGEVWLWEIASGRLRLVGTEPAGPSGAPRVIVQTLLAPDGTLFWSTADGALAAKRANEDQPRVMRGLMSGSPVWLGLRGSNLVAISRDSILMWDPDSRASLEPLPVEVKAAHACFARDGRLALVAGLQGMVWAIDPPTATEYRPSVESVLRSNAGGDWSSVHVVASADGERVWASFDGLVLPVRGVPFDPAIPRGAVNALAVSPDGTRLISGTADGFVQSYSLADGRPGAQSRGRGEVQALDVSPGELREVAVARSWDHLAGGVIAVWTDDADGSETSLEMTRTGRARTNLRYASSRALFLTTTTGLELAERVKSEFTDLLTLRPTFPSPSPWPGMPATSIAPRFGLATRAPSSALVAFANRVYEQDADTPSRPFLVGEWKVQVSHVALAPRSGRLVVGTGFGVRSYALPTDGSALSEESPAIELAPSRPIPLTAVVVGPDDRVAIGRWDGAIELRSPTGALEATADLRALNRDVPWTFAFDREGKRLLVGTRRGAILVFALPGS